MADTESRKRKRVNKNRKKAWRKNVDITDVEEYLDDKRLQERTGGLVTEKPDERLFYVDARVPSKDAIKVSKKNRTKKFGPLKCFANLEPAPGIQSPKGYNVIKNLRKHMTTKQLHAEDGIFSKKQKQAVDQRDVAFKNRSKARIIKKMPKTAKYDLWGEEPVVTDPLLKNEHYLRVTKKMPVKYPNLLRMKASALPAIEVAHPGTSYNPTYEDHQELLQMALDALKTKKKEVDRIDRATTHFQKPGQAPTQASWLKEMSAGIFDDSNAKKKDDDPVDLDKLSVNPPVRREDKKTRAERNKIKKQKLKEKEILLTKELRAKDSQFYRLRSMKKVITDMERKKEAKRLTRAGQRLADVYRTKKLGRLKYEDPDLEIKLSSELEGSLRRLKPEGNILHDRFKSFQKRNILETRNKAIQHRRYKIKMVEKKKHREVTL